MKILLKVRRAWGAVRWKMLIIFVFFSVVSMILAGCLAVAILNVVVRRESAYLLEERIKVMVDEPKEWMDSSARGVYARSGSRSAPLPLIDRQDDARPGSPVTVLPWSASEDAWIDAVGFAGVVADHGHLEIRSFRKVEREGRSVKLTAQVALDDQFLKLLARSAGLQVVDSRPALLGPYRAAEGIGGEIEANFVPGSRRPVPIVVPARNWQTGQLEDWVLCQVRPSYSRTIEDLSHMGLRTASWVAPFGGIALGLACAYALGLVLSLGLAKRIVNVIDGLSHAFWRVGKGDFSVSVTDREQDQLGRLAASFNAMTHDLENLREHERQRAILDLPYLQRSFCYCRGGHMIAHARGGMFGVSSAVVACSAQNSLGGRLGGNSASCRMITSSTRS